MANTYQAKYNGNYLAYLEVNLDTDNSNIIVQQYTFVKFYTTLTIVRWVSSDPSKLEVYSDGTGFAHSDSGTVTVTGYDASNNTVSVTITLAPFNVQRINVTYV